jgi:hypothetical protein
MRSRLLFLVCALLLAAGCNSKAKFAPVSGKVTLDGKPLANATVSFQPIAEEESAIAGVGSTGKTNENGEFALTAATGEKGAVVGKHRVVITKVEEQGGTGDERPPRGGWPQKDKIPSKYNSESKETFDVPSGGTTAANFNLTSQ